MPNLSLCPPILDLRGKTLEHLLDSQDHRIPGKLPNRLIIGMKEWAYASGMCKGPEYDAECRGLLH